MHFRGAGTLQRAQVRVFGEKLAAEGAPAVILGFDANSKTHMEYVHWVYQNFLFKKEYENMVPTMKEELQNFSVGQKYDEEVQELFLEQMPNLKRIAP
ncbi:unnamed protein product [Amoebophrya sp. A120]|nr:unnamed protein product [Amoebophrya sp. A120]|eukprot:GSA120T00024604001.1